MEETYCSLGGLCHSAQLLKVNGLKKASYPFDWIFSNLQMIEDCISNDFKTFLDKSQYSDYTTNSTLKENQCEHNFYGKMLSNPDHNIIFNHHNPLSNQKDYEYLERCVNRFRDLLKSDERKKFVILTSDEDSLTNNLKKASNFSDFIGKYTQRHKLLIINNKVTGHQSHEWVMYNNIRFLQLETKSNSNGLQFCNETDEDYLNKIVSYFDKI